MLQTNFQASEPGGYGDEEFEYFSMYFSSFTFLRSLMKYTQAVWGQFGDII